VERVVLGWEAGLCYAARVGSSGWEWAAEDFKGYDAPDEKSAARLARLEIRMRGGINAHESSTGVSSTETELTGSSAPRWRSVTADSRDGCETVVSIPADMHSERESPSWATGVLGSGHLSALLRYGIFRGFLCSLLLWRRSLRNKTVWIFLRNTDCVILVLNGIFRKHCIYRRCDAVSYGPTPRGP